VIVSLSHWERVAEGRVRVATPGWSALIRRFAAPSPSGRREKAPARGRMKRPWCPSSYRWT